MSAAVGTRASAHIHWHLRAESGGFKRLQPVQQPFRSKGDRQLDWKIEKPEAGKYLLVVYRRDSECSVAEIFFAKRWGLRGFVGSPVAEFF